MTKLTTGKSPYEIRLELLQMAQTHLQNAFEQQLYFATEVLKVATDSHMKTVEQLRELMPKTYTVEDILAKAAGLYGFVQKKD